MKKILWVSDMGFEGYLPLNSSYNFHRPPLTWIYALNAYNIHYTQVHKIKEKFDLAIIASIHENIDVTTIDIQAIKQVADKIAIQQESHHRNFFNFKNIIDSTHYIYLYQNCDFILTHNKIDSVYFSTLFNKPYFINPQLMSLDISSYKKEDKIILPGNLDSRYGNFDNYLIGLETDLPMHVTKMHTYREEESLLENLIHHPYNSNYYDFNKLIGTSKLALYLIPYPLGGSFPIQCAMMKTPCISWNTSDTSLECYPDLSFDYGDFDSVRNAIKKLDNPGFLNKINEFAYQVVLDKFTNIEYYKDYIFNKLCTII